MTSILAIRQTNPLSPRLSEPSYFLAVGPSCPHSGTSYKMFMTDCELAFIPNKSLRACSLDAAWIRVFSDSPSTYEHFCGKT
jgi:hypothetical protein